MSWCRVSFLGLCLSVSLLGVAVSGGCQGGSLLLDAWGCADVTCPTGFTCEEGVCVPGCTRGVDCPPCTPAFPNGECPSGQRCADGVCVDGGSAPKECDAGTVGSCPAGETCTRDGCRPLPSDNLCSVDRPRGECQGDQICLGGLCYRSEGIPCSAQNPTGLCPEGQQCLSGSCAPRATTCSAERPDGTCPGWYQCVQGYCVGPTPPDLCSPELSHGRCPADQVCLQGTCSPIHDENMCGTEDPRGLCPAGAACDGGMCVEITEDNACAPGSPDGLCEAGAVCEGGQCEHVPCGNGGHLCEQDHGCTETGECHPLLCDLAHPQGLCVDTLLSCVEGVCMPPVCSIEEPEGGCPPGLVCTDGSCRLPDCSPSFPNGYCEGEAVCVNGWCQEGPCSINNLDGACEGTLVSCTPQDGCIFETSHVCCNEQRQASTGCALGTCEPPVCSASDPHGTCAAGQYCEAGSCAPAPCSRDFSSGYCEGADEVCYRGRCRTVGCAQAEDPDAACSPLQCDEVLNICVREPCSLENPEGVCMLGHACCNEALSSDVGCQLGSCFEPDCSVEFPGGGCPSGQLCAGAAGCVTPPCSSRYTRGACGANFVCLDGVCEMAECSSGAPQGYCPRSMRCVYGVCLPYECSEVFPDGPCPVGYVCSSNTCVLPACSESYPGGTCPEGQICVDGDCNDGPCSSVFPDGRCGAGFRCQSGQCFAAPCSRSSPSGSCLGADAGKVCKDGACVEYACGPHFPDGAPCPNLFEICEGATCLRPQCSAEYIGGTCDSPQVCVGGACTTPACSPQVPEGECPSGQICCDAGLQTERGCPVGVCVLAECGAPGLAADVGYCPSGQRCHQASCEPHACSPSFPNGPCPPGQTCQSNACELAPCGPTYIGGHCESAGEVCVNGVCTPVLCSPQAPEGACPTDRICCDADLVSARGCVLGACVPVDCAAATPTGYCPAGQICCSEELVGEGVCSVVGQCEITTCSSAFPLGRCPDGELCIGGTCVTPCSDSVRTGWCPQGLACVEGACLPCASCGCSTDSDCDGISNAVESSSSGTDTDGDGSPDYLDRDADGDMIPDLTESSADLDGDGAGNWRDLDADGDHISDTDEAGGAPAAPQDSDGDGTADFLDPDADGDGIDDACEVGETATLCDATGIVPSSALFDSDLDGTPDYLDLDSDEDGIPDSIEARSTPHLPQTLTSTGVDHDADGTPDYRDPDSDGDGVADADEDVNGDGLVNCQVDGTGAQVVDARATPACGATVAYPVAPFAPGYVYDYNPLCHATGGTEKCLLAESSRVHPESDGDGHQDDQDGVFLVCSAENLKPINVFYSQEADYALALEQGFTHTRSVRRAGVEAGMLFGNVDVSTGSYAVAGFILQRIPDASALATVHTDPARELRDKALAQESIDRALLATASDVAGVSLVINRNFTSFDGYGAVVSRYDIDTDSTVSTWELRDALVRALGPGLNGFSTTAGGPDSNAFTLVTETVYRWDNGSDDGSVVLVGALVPTRSPLFHSYAMRDTCQQTEHILEAETFDSHTTLEDHVDPADNHIWQHQTNLGGYSGSGYLRAMPNSGVTCGSNVVDCGAALTYNVRISRAGRYYAHFLIAAGSRNDDSLSWGIDGVHYQQLVTSPDNNTWSWNTGGGAVVNLDEGEHVLNVWMREDGQRLDMVALSMSRTPPSNPVATGVCPPGCIDTGSECVSQGGFQIPLFFVDNITNGSALAQYGDDLAALCQSMVQEHGKLDFLWIVDDSGSMVHEIAQVQTSATLFFGIMNNTEADYRIAQTTTYEDRGDWEPTHLFEDQGADEAGRRNGALQGGFTGAVGGIVDPAAADRAVTYDCADGCDNGAADCCALCPSAGAVQDPACYFASRLPTATSRGQEFGLLMGEWALYRAGVRSLCASITDNGLCEQTAGCAVLDGMCAPNNCSLPSCPDAASEADCELTAGCHWTGSVCQLGIDDAIAANECNGHGTSGDGQVPFGNDEEEDELQPGGCEWNPRASAGAGACWPSIGTQCGRNTDEAACLAVAPRCSWQSGYCVPSLTYGRVLCSASDAATCGAQGGGFCQWDPAGYCRPPSEYAFRGDATHVAVVLSDEEECYLKDGGFDGTCDFSEANYIPYDHPVRLAREESYLRFYQARDFMLFGIVGDKADRSQSPGSTGGCTTAQSGDAYIKVAEGTGGGWGSICAIDLYPTIEAIVISSIAKASPYRLEGFIDGAAVQPISSTIKVAVQVCDDPTEYPTCDSGTHMEVVARSRDNGFDYDAINNTLILYGAARPVVLGDIVVSYRYWVDREQPPEGVDDCPCPQTSRPDCACPPGEACGLQDGVNNCAGKTAQADCEGTAGCSWNTANGGGCFVNGLCEADPTCGGGCEAGSVCDPNIGLCICDVTCASSCGAGDTCDDNFAVHGCEGVSESDCGSVAGCSWDALVRACVSVTCGQCVCNTDPAGCPLGWARDTDDATPSPTCGLCLCDVTCADACTGASLLCDDNSACAGLRPSACANAGACGWDAATGECVSHTCGLCQPRLCGDCPAGHVCDAMTGTCVCDTTCGGDCPAGSACDRDTTSLTCGQCVCDTTCDGDCPTGTLCDDDTSSPSCGLCIATGDCAAPCNEDCAGQGDVDSCNGLGVCRWAPWLNGGGGGCHPAVCQVCASGAGLCVVDAECCGACGADNPGGNPGDICNPNTGRCECDTGCGGGCGAGRVCDSDPSHIDTCGQCLCDPTCGGACPTGTLCDNDLSSSTCGLCVADPGCGVSGACSADCDASDESSCDVLGGACRWAPWLRNGRGECVPVTCEVCNPVVGQCLADPECCGSCGPHETCNSATGRCECDSNCSYRCGPGLSCDGDPGSASCGQCLCDTTCGGPCPQGLACDDNAACQGLDERACTAAGVCVWDMMATLCLSPYCGLCIIDPTCGDCGPSQICNPVTGLCEPQCPDCPPGQVCDPSTGECICDVTCNGFCPLGSLCDGALSSPTCGECLCDPTCGGGCPLGMQCDGNEGCAGLSVEAGGACEQSEMCGVDPVAGACRSPTCGVCLPDPDCGGECPPDFICDSLTGLCVPDPDCGGCAPGYECDLLTLECVPGDG